MEFSTASLQLKFFVNAMLLAELLGDRVENHFCMVQGLQKF